MASPALRLPSQVDCFFEILHFPFGHKAFQYFSSAYRFAPSSIESQLDGHILQVINLFRQKAARSGKTSEMLRDMIPNFDMQVSSPPNTRYLTLFKEIHVVKKIKAKSQ